MEINGPICLPQNTNYAIVGSIGSGKSYIMSLIIKYRDMLFKEKIDHVYYCYKIWNHIFDDLEKSGDVTFIEGMPTVDQLKSLKANSILVFDDMGHEIFKNDDILEVALVMCRHKKITTFALLHNLFMKGQSARSYFLNVGVYILFENKRDVQQIKHLGRQIFGSAQFLLESYKMAVKENEYGYILIDLASKLRDEFKLRTSILPGQDMICFKPQ